MDTEGIAEFLAVADAGSFTGASRSLGVSIAHVSRRVAALEEKLSVQLFVRSTRTVKLTIQGEEFQVRCHQLREELEEILQSVHIQNRSLQGRIRVASLSGSFADHVIAPAIADFAAAHPDIEIEIDFSPRIVDLRREGYDIAIRSGPLEDSSLILKPLAMRTVVAAASQDYLDKYGTPEHPKELQHHNCILSSGNIWYFKVNQRIKKFRVKGKFSANSGVAITKACELGLGIAYMSEKGYGKSLNNGKLIPILKPYWRTDHAVNLLYANKRLVPRRIQLLIEHLLSAAKNNI